MHYSRSTGGFYDVTIHGDGIPPDAVEITTANHVALLEGQSQGKRIVSDMHGGPVLAPALPPSTDQIWSLIKAERDRRNRGGYKVGALWFHSDPGSRIQQLGLVMMGANIPNDLQWKTMDGSFVTMTLTLAQQVFAAAAASDQAIFAAAETHKAAMEACADPASYDFSTGWPLTFGE